MKAAALALVTLGLALAPLCATAAPHDYRWLAGRGPIITLCERIAPPVGFERDPVPLGSFAEWLRGLPVRASDAPVRLHTGALKANQDAHVAVIDIDVGARDLQQCADAIMRLRAEWLFASDRLDAIGFNYTNGVRVPFSRWMRGERPKPAGARVTWQPSGQADASYRSFRKYMDQVFGYAGTASLERELQPVAAEDMRIGDVFIKGGFPGHAVLVVDMVRNAATGERRFLLLQSFMPARTCTFSRTLPPAMAPHGIRWTSGPSSSHRNGRLRAQPCAAGRSVHDEHFIRPADLLA